eukprot:scpid98235/ scgid19525/ 
MLRSRFFLLVDVKFPKQRSDLPSTIPILVLCSPRLPLKSFAQLMAVVSVAVASLCVCMVWCCVVQRQVQSHEVAACARSKSCPRFDTRVPQSGMYEWHACRRVFVVLSVPTLYAAPLYGIVGHLLL